MLLGFAKFAYLFEVFEMNGPRSRIFVTVRSSDHDDVALLVDAGDA